MSFVPTAETETTEMSRTPRRVGRRRPRLRWASAALVVVGVLGFAGVSCSPKDVAQIAVSNHFEPSQRDCAMRIIQRESNYQADARNPYSGTLGLFQIHPTHTSWIRSTYGYAFGELTDANKNAQVARGLSNSAQAYYGDRWQPWRYGGQVIRGGGCPA